MPTLSMFYGIIVTMHREVGNRHKLPHIHAEYQGKEVVVSIRGKVLEGKIPAKKMKLLSAWMEIHKDDLEANWHLLSQGREYFKIDPLR